MAKFICWRADDETEKDARPAFEKTRDWQREPCLTDSDFERAAKLFAERVHSDWDYPDELDLFVMNEETRETRFVKVTVESGAPDFSARDDSKDAAMRLFFYRYTAPARAAMEHRPRPWNWKQLRWERLNPEEAAAQKAERARQRFERIDGRCPWPTGEAPATWDAVQWPEWVPLEVRDAITGFRTRPKEYEDTFACNGAQPRLGEVVTLESWSQGREFITGRYVGNFNQSGWVITDSGAAHRGHALHGLTAADIAARIEERRVKRLREAVAKAVLTADADALERALRVLVVGKPVEVANAG